MNAESRSLVLVAGGIVATAIVAIVVVLSTSAGEPTAYAASTPEGVVQRYLVAQDGGDLATAHSYFSSRVRDEVDIDSYRAMVDGNGYPAQPSAIRRVLFDGTDDATGIPDRIIVRLTVEEVYGRGLDGEVSRSAYEIPMVLEPDGWRIDELLVWLYPAPVPDLPAN